MQKNQIIRYWRNVRGLTIKLCELFPENQFDFRPIAAVRSVAEQFNHIVGVERYTLNGLTLGDWEFKGEQGLSNEKSAIIELLKTENQKTAQLLSQLNESEFNKIHHTKFGDMSGEVVAYVAIDEEIHHRGNLYVYARMLNIEPPQMVQKYGEIFLED